VLGHAKFLRQRELPFECIECAIAAIELKPACLAQITFRPGLREQRLVLGERAREQRAHQPRGLDQSLGTRSGAKLQEPGRNLRQEAQVIIGFRRALERDPQQRDRIRGEGGRKDGVAFDHAGIAVRGLFAGCAAIQKRNRKPALGEMQPNGGADNAGTEHDGIDARHGVPSQTFAPPARARGRPQLRDLLIYRATIWVCDGADGSPI